MRIAVVGRGSVGGGLAGLWERAGHEVVRLGRGGGDISDAEALLFAVPGGAVADTPGRLAGAEGKTVIDATNLIGGEPPEWFRSNAEFLKARIGGPAAKSFNINFAALYGRLAEARDAKQHLVWDDEARDVVERLNRDAGFEPVYAGGSRTPLSRRASSASCSPSTRPASASSSTAWRRSTSSKQGRCGCAPGGSSLPWLTAVAPSRRLLGGRRGARPRPPAAPWDDPMLDLMVAAEREGMLSPQGPAQSRRGNRSVRSPVDSGDRTARARLLEAFSAARCEELLLFPARQVDLLAEAALQRFATPVRRAPRSVSAACWPP